VVLQMPISLTTCNVSHLLLLMFAVLFTSFLTHVANGIVKNSRVADAMRAVDRGHFSRNNPYMDSPQGIGYSVTISAPHMVL
jgi:hypothetical protein